MSYVRFGRDSDVYVIGTIVNGMHVLECCGCKLSTETATEEPPDPSFTVSSGILGHLDEHREAGHAVPQYAYDDISGRASIWLKGS
jgi:hypothetical protein